ncbi:NAD-dependent epimerase/dehydratase family protein [Mucilaginibacter sp. KACC 22063]|uniref:NAD-dependent epimerase/dehydratase family protein n=1 Tax=Mucilaginibacter sp. KACC 22063 TaxID=3025666 RepID=UPI0023665807|nr:NAD(P)-dependent oxidoreductase [Mucilaginibacter sp. KACC 22063]WDF54703.1 NAD(P)-dependent oxidoreductase [Mucilaginibacter sp. KACC 22063]
MAKIFITGITGFIGSNIARVLVDKGHHIIALYRASSKLELCDDYKQKITWLLDSDEALILKLKQFAPSIFIHSAWIGVTYEERNNWDSQFKNIEYLNKLLEIAKEAGVKQFISLGSQAEYGHMEDVVKEDAANCPTVAYGRIKVICSEVVKQFCEHHGLSWYWLRLFSFFGPGESSKWLIPSLVKTMISESHMDMTAGEQRYAYLYVNDLGTAINLIIEKSGKSGIYNISGKTVLSIKQLAERVREIVNPFFKLNFGALPYRSNQPMCVLGSSDKFIKEFGDFEHTNFDHALSTTVTHLKNSLTIRK